VFVAADRGAGGAVQVPQPGQPVAAQYEMHRRRVQPEQVDDAGGSPPTVQPDFDDSSFDTRFGLS
jgi:hypothetical protein